MSMVTVKKGAAALLVPASCRRQLLDLSDDVATKVNIQYHADAGDALLKVT